MWTYQQSTGQLRDETGQLIWIGYAGRDAGKNNPAMQAVKGVGPLPRGLYTAQPPADDPVVGCYAMRLVPDPSNEMYGRCSFFEHGDAREHPGLASHGCIVMPRQVRGQFWQQCGDHRLQVVE
jgi:hypothetical protein